MPGQGSARRQVSGARGRARLPGVPAPVHRPGDRRLAERAGEQPPGAPRRRQRHPRRVLRPEHVDRAGGSGTVFINNKQAHRLNDMDKHCGGIGRMIEGSTNVITGG